jgi:two-component system, NarL family, response regulator LiaR
MIRILIVDDHPVVRDGLAAVLETQPDFELAGQASHGEEALQKAAELRPDVVLLDLEMPGMDGVEILQALRLSHHEINTIVFTAFDSDERIIGALRAGAQGYLLKGAPREDLYRAIRTVSSGGSLLQPVVAKRLLKHVAGPNRPLEAGAGRLTAREAQVLNLVAKGMTNKAIAAKLVVSERTVKFHVSSILRKLEAGNRTEAVSMAAQKGLIEI